MHGGPFFNNNSLCMCFSFFRKFSWDEFTRGPPPVRKQQHEKAVLPEATALLASHMETKIPIAMKILDATEIHVRQLIYIYRVKNISYYIYIHIIYTSTTNCDMASPKVHRFTSQLTGLCLNKKWWTLYL